MDLSVEGTAFTCLVSIKHFAESATNAFPKLSTPPQHRMDFLTSWSWWSPSSEIRGICPHRLACWLAPALRQGLHPLKNSTQAAQRMRLSETTDRENHFALEESGGEERGSYWDTSAMCLWRRVIHRSSSSSRSTSFTRASPMPLVSYLERGCPHKIHPVPSGL